MLACDLSNYTSDLIPSALAAWKDTGVGLVIVQAVSPPPGYPLGKTRNQIQQCLDAGLAVDAYIWLWFDLGPDDIQHKLALLDGLPIRRLWLDVEDAAAAKYDQYGTELAVTTALSFCDTYPTTSGLKTGIYSGLWYWADRDYMGNTTTFSDRDLWDAHYDGLPNAIEDFTPYGGWSRCAIKQYQGTTSLSGINGIDLNVLSADEEARLQQPSGGNGNVDDQERKQYQDEIDGLVNDLGYLCGDALKPLTRATAAKYVKTYVGIARSVAEQQGIAHA